MIYGIGIESADSHLGRAVDGTEVGIVADCGGCCVGKF